MSDLVSKRLANKDRGRIESREDLEKVYTNLDNISVDECDSNYVLRSWPCDSLRVPCAERYRLK